MKKLKILLLLSGILLICTGCITSTEFNCVENMIKEQINPARIKTNFKFSFGPVSLSTARTFINIADNEKEVDTYLKEITSVQLGIYEIHSTERSHQLNIPGDIKNNFNKLGWEMFVNAKNNNEHVNLYYRQINDVIGSMYVVVLERHEMIIVEVRGRLDKIIEAAIREHGLPQKKLLNIS